MKDCVLTLIDTSKIQEYVFKSNRLQDNIGASEIVRRATTCWVFECLKDLGLKNNVKNGQSLNWHLDDRLRIECDDLHAEIVYAGGGNTLMIFRDLDIAGSFTRKLTFCILKRAPGLTIIAQHMPVDLEKHRLDRKRDELLTNMAIHKQARLPATPILGLGVTASCVVTGLPANQLRPQYGLTQLTSSEVTTKLDYAKKANQRLKDTVGEDIIRSFDFPEEIDKLGRIKGEESHVAVVHADGNRMGAHLEDIAKRVDWRVKKEGNRDYINRLRDFSGKLNAAGLQALKRVVLQVVRNLKWDNQTGTWIAAQKIPLNGSSLPFRPLVFGGDDVTFVCNGRLGLALTASYLDAFEQETKQRGLDFFARAGIAIVKMHYPFSRAYALAEALSGEAKRVIPDDDDCSALDWHFASSGISGTLSMIRDREYRVESGDLILRPLCLHKSGPLDTRFWNNGLESVIKTFQTDEAWINRRNKLKELREILRKGPEEVASYLRDYDLPDLPVLIEQAPESGKTGWRSNRCLYFDAIELLDHFVPLSI